MEKEYKISWLKVIGIIVLIVIIIAILYLIYPNKNSKGSFVNSSTFINNINLMKEAGYDYFQGSALPESIGETTKISLREMVSSDLIVEFFDEEGKSCNKEDSYIQVTKKLEDEYSMKVFLSCDNMSDYIITTIVDDYGNIDYENDSLEDNKDEKETIKYDVADKSSSRSESSSNSNISGTSGNNSSNKKVTYVTNYNINYVNNCKNCTDTDCSNNCMHNIYHSVYFDSNGGTDVARQIVKHGYTADYKTSTRTGYTFLGWYLDGAKYNFDTPVTKKITLIAKWKKIEEEAKKEEYTVKFDSNGGSKVPSQTVEEGDTATKPKNPTRDCYDFKGWYIDSKLTKKYDFSTPVTADITLYAKWVENDSCKNEYTVDFDSNGGSKVPSQSVEEGDTATKPKNPTRDCYDFKGWYIDSKLTKKYDFSTPVTADITLYAKWVENDSCKNEYTVDFDSNGGSKVPSQTVEEGDTATKPKNPTRDCYDFKGWYTNSALTKKYDFDTIVTKDMTLYAKWEDNGSCKVQYTVKFNSNGGTKVSSQIVDEGARAEEPNDPIRDGYIFEGWYLDGVKFKFVTKIYEDITLVAKWAKEEVKYNTYCAIKEERIYSTGYVGKNIITDNERYNYSYVLKYKNADAINMKVLDYGNIETSTQYKKAYNYLINSTKPITMVNDSGNGIDPGSAANLKDYSLKSSNFITRVKYDYKSGNYWYFNVYNSLVSLSNIKNASAFYTSANYYVYFVPLYFDIQYTDTDDCVNDKASNASKYKNDYEVIDTFYK